MTSHAKDCSFQVFFMSSQINKGDDFSCSGTDFNPIQRAMVRLVDNITTAVKTENIIANWWSSSCFNFMLVTKKFLPGKSTTIIHFSMSQDTQKGWLTSINITNDCNTVLIKKTFFYTCHLLTFWKVTEFLQNLLCQPDGEQDTDQPLHTLYFFLAKVHSQLLV